MTSSTPRVIMLTGSPGAGKDTLAMWLSAKLGWRVLAFKDTLLVAAYRFAKTQNPLMDWETFNLFVSHRELKDNVAPSPFFIGEVRVTPREYLKHIAEQVIKPAFGNDVFAREIKAAANRDCIISDLRFPEELKAFDNPLVIHLHNGFGTEKTDMPFDLSIDTSEEYWHRYVEEVCALL